MKFIKKIHSLNENDTIQKALYIITKSGLRGAVVLDRKDNLSGVISDGDIRKILIKKIDFGVKIKSFLNKKPVLISHKKDLSKFDLKNFFLKNSVTFIPIVRGKKVIKIIKLEEIFNNNNESINKNTKIVLMAGGLGTRLLPYTNILPKPLIPVGDKPMLEHIMKSFVDQKFNNFFLSVGFKSGLIKTYFANKKKYRIKFFDEKKQLGTVGSLKNMAKYLKNDFILANCDTIFKIDFNSLLESHLFNKNDITLVLSKKDYKIPYGVCKILRSGKLSSISEKPIYNFLINTGLYIVSPKVIKFIKSSKMDMVELIKLCMKKRLKISSTLISNNSWKDFGSKEEIII